MTIKKKLMFSNCFMIQIFKGGNLYRSVFRLLSIVGVGLFLIINLFPCITYCNESLDKSSRFEFLIDVQVDYAYPVALLLGYFTKVPGYSMTTIGPYGVGVGIKSESNILKFSGSPSGLGSFASILYEKRNLIKRYGLSLGYEKRWWDLGESRWVEGKLEYAMTSQEQMFVGVNWQTKDSSFSPLIGIGFLQGKTPATTYVANNIGLFFIMRWEWLLGL